MELPTSGNKTILPDTGQYENLPLTLVGELLTAILSNDEEKILVKGNSWNFIYDAKACAVAGKPTKVEIHEPKVIQQENTIEISFSGTIETENGLQQPCDLYFYMWWDHTQPSPLKQQNTKKLQPTCLLIHPKKLSEDSLSDSVFELDLYRRTTLKQQEYFGQARGYLVFNRTN